MTMEMKMSDLASSQFPQGFLFGAATASYQIEGAPVAHGKGTSIWDVFTGKRGKIHNGDTGDVACRHYYKMQEDVNLMKELNLQAYRFSISWPRVMPQGMDGVNRKGLDFYDRLVDELLLKGIEPWITLYHWDLPQALQEKGGWTNRDIAEWFADYVDAVMQRLGDRAHNWITLNEPKIFTMLGNLLGMHAPGYKNPWKYFRAVHNALRAHGRAVQVIRSYGERHRVGITLDLSPIYPERDIPKDRAAAERAHQALNRFFLDPVLKGEYPEFRKKVRLFMPVIRSGDMDLIHQPLDFLGINNYSRSFVRASRVPGFRFMANTDVAEHEFVRDGVQYTAMGWEVYPRGIYELLTMIRDEYENIPVYITENGAAYSDVMEEDGTVNDNLRRDFLKSYLSEVQRACDEGAACRGYFVWSLLDNFEWAEGYAKRFGLIHVDYPSGTRTIKNSGYWYRDFIASR